MSNRFPAYWIFLPLGLIFFILNRGGDEVILSCTFYSFFVGVVWTMIPRISGEQGLPWRHLLPPVMLVILMMFAARMRMMNNAETITFTAMGLLNFRAAVLAFGRLGKQGRVFSLIQVFSFLIVMGYLFQKNLFATLLMARTHFLMTMMMLGMVSMGFLWKLRKQYEPAVSPANDS